VKKSRVSFAKKSQAGTAKKGLGSAKKPDYGKPINQTRLQDALKLIRDAKENGDLDLVERCNSFELPLTISNDEEKTKVFYAALAELCSCYDSHSAAARRLMSPFLGRGEKDKFKNSKDGRHKFVNLKSYLPHTMDTIISMAYPWFSQILYTTLFRLNREQRLDVQEYESFEGTYRYFRSFPIKDNTFVLRDGRMKVVLDKKNNMICLGHASQNWTGGDFAKAQFEHRGFVVPGAYKTDLISFRGSITRFASIAGDLDHECEGTILTSSRGRNNPPRPFVAQFLLVKESHELAQLEIPSVKINDENVFDTESEQYQKVLERFRKRFRNTVSEKDGFMWGTSAAAAREASKKEVSATDPA
jgi:hypothetical protein